MNLSHYTSADEPLKLQKNHIYSLHKQRREQELLKPTGLWISVDGEDDWPSWCNRNDWAPERLSRRYKIWLKPEHNIKILASVDSILEFTKHYRTDSYYTFNLYWPLIRQSYQGLIISPFQWDLHLCSDCSWYYSWDCESGCIWDVSSIERYEEDLSWNH